MTWLPPRSLPSACIEFGARKPLWRPVGTAGGEKVRVVTYLGRTRNFEIDVWVGGKRSPDMRFIETASMLPGLPPVRMLAYPLEAMAADKLHAVVQFGAANTRRKDYYDLVHLSRAGLDMRLLAACIETTFRNNGRPVPTTPLDLPRFSREFPAANQDAWTRMLADAGRAGRLPVRCRDGAGVRCGACAGGVSVGASLLRGGTHAEGYVLRLGISRDPRLLALSRCNHPTDLSLALLGILPVGRQKSENRVLRVRPFMQSVKPMGDEQVFGHQASARMQASRCATAWRSWATSRRRASASSCASIAATTAAFAMVVI